MKSVYLFLVKSWMRIGLFFYFKKIEVHGLNNLPLDKPVMLMSNHQSALIDPLLIATNIKHFAHYLTRASVFKKSFVKKILHSFNMMPVFRVRDGWNNLANNNPIFDKCTEILKSNNTLVLFPEGSHNLVRRVRPLSKGFTRIIFGTLDKYPDLELQLIPLGLNYQDITGFVDSASMYFGDPIDARAYLKFDRHEGTVRLKKDLHSAIAALTTHIPKDNYEEVLGELDQRQVDYLRPKAVNQCISSGFENCDARVSNTSKGLKRFLLILMKIVHCVPYLVWKRKVQPKLVEPEFTATFRFAVATVLAPLVMILVAIALGLLIGWKWALIYMLSVLAITLLAVKI